MTTSEPGAGDITVLQTLALLDGPFAEMAEGVADDAYAIWLGSGISFARMPGLKAVAEAVLTYLQERCEPTDKTCRFRASLDEILRLVMTGAEADKIDVAKPVSEWTDLGQICDRLVLNYARMLDQAPVGEREDYLVWNAVDVVARYGAPDIQPSVEHLALAALVMEGVSSDIASANWDALVERAIEKLAGSQDPALLQVRVLPAETRGPASRSRLYKFHGCAVLAGADEASYRSKIVGRASQINGWVQRGENAVVAAKLVDLARSKPTLMLGLSAQDSNIQAIFVAAKEQMSWDFPSHPPAYVFSEDRLQVDQRGLLLNVYGENYTANRPDVTETALLRSYASSLLPALWLHVVFSKLASLGITAGQHLAGPERAAIVEGLRVLRDSAARAANGADPNEYIEAAIAVGGRGLNLARHGSPPAAGIYSPVTATPRAASLADPNLPASGMGEFALGLGLIGAGNRQGLWNCATSASADAKVGALRLESEARQTEVFFAANSHAAAQMVMGGHVSDDDEAVLIHSHDIPAPARRSPAASVGRNGKLGLREISMASLLAGEPDLPTMLGDLKAEMCL